MSSVPMKNFYFNTAYTGLQPTADPIVPNPQKFHQGRTVSLASI